MNASSEAAGWATWTTRGSVMGTPALFTAARMLQRASDVGAVACVLGELLRELGRRGGDELALVLAGDRGVGAHACREGESEEVVRLRAQNGVGLRLRHGVIARHLTDPPEVVALVGVEGADQLVGAHRHRREDEQAVALSLLVVAHHAVEEARRTLLGREARDVGGAAAAACRGSHFAAPSEGGIHSRTRHRCATVIQPDLRKRVAWPVERAAALGAKVLSG